MISTFNNYSTSALDMIANEVLSTELAIIIPYPSSVSGIIVLLKTIKKYCYILLILLCQNDQKTI